MSVWDKYETRIGNVGPKRRDAAYKRDVREFNLKNPNSLSYHHVTIEDAEQDVMIVTARNTNQRRIMSMPGETIKLGGLVHWMDNYWLITEKDADTTIYEKGLMEQCNYVVRWITTDTGEPVIHEQWCIISDSTKYMTGEFEDRQFIVTRPDSRIAMTIARNEDTVKFTRKTRFLIDDPDSPIKLSYSLTKPVKLGMVYNGEGVFSFVMQEENSTADDNHVLGVADYYKYFTDDGKIREDWKQQIGTGIVTDDNNGSDPDQSVDDAEHDSPTPDVTEKPVKKGWL